MTSNYPPGVNDRNFDRLCWGISYDLNQHCCECGNLMPDQREYCCEECQELVDEEQLLYSEDEEISLEEWESICLGCGKDCDCHE